MGIYGIRISDNPQARSKQVHVAIKLNELNIHDSMSRLDRHVAGAWPRAHFGHKFTKALRHELNC